MMAIKDWFFRRNDKRKIKPCWVCGYGFYGPKVAKYCSDACRQKAFRIRRDFNGETVSDANCLGPQYCIGPFREMKFGTDSRCDVCTEQRINLLGGSNARLSK